VHERRIADGTAGIAGAWDADGSGEGEGAICRAICFERSLASISRTCARSESTFTASLTSSPNRGVREIGGGEASVDEPG
jgi:hypothetical protein